jgi:hypothetical protein
LSGLLGQDDLHVAAQERPRQRHLLLVAARQRLYRLLERRHPDAQPLHERVDRPTLSAATQETPAS